MTLILSIVDGLETQQVDYVNASTQADLNRDVSVEISKGYGHLNDGTDCIAKQNNYINIQTVRQPKISSQNNTFFIIEHYKRTTGVMQKRIFK